MDSTQLYRTLRAAALTIAPEWSKTLRRNGFVVLNNGQPETREATLTPVVLTTDQMEEASQTGRLLSNAAVKVVAAARDNPELRATLLSPFSGKVLDVAEANLAGPVPAHTRTDLFGDGRAVEINAACPALSGYTDILARTFIEQIGKEAGLSEKQIAELQEQNGSNARALYDGLISGYQRQRPGVNPKEITILCRRNTTPLPELEHLARRFQEYGTHCRIVYPDQLEVRGGQLWVSGESTPLDFVYRLMPTARLLDLGNHLVEFFLIEPSSRETVVLNNLAPHQESKLPHALLSMATRDPQLAAAAGLDDAELATIARVVPWTEILTDGPAVGPNGQPISDLRQWTIEHAAGVVIKGVVGDRGNRVFVGCEPEKIPNKAENAYGTPMSWDELARSAGATPDGIAVVQALQQPVYGTAVLPTPGGGAVEQRVMKSGAIFGFPGTGIRGGVVGQISPSYIGHRGDGGHFAPPVAWPVAQELAAAWAQRHP